jgi:exonuclease I
VRDLRFAHKKAQPTKHQIRLPDVQDLFHPADTLEPHQLYHPGIVFEVCHKAAASFFTDHFQVDQFTRHLAIFRGSGNAAYFFYPGLVDVADREKIKQVAERKNTQLFAEQVAFYSGDPRKVFNGRL